MVSDSSRENQPGVVILKKKKKKVMNRRTVREADIINYQTATFLDSSASPEQLVARNRA